MFASYYTSEGMIEYIVKNTKNTKIEKKLNFMYVINLLLLSTKRTIRLPKYFKFIYFTDSRSKLNMKLGRITTL